MSRPRRSACWRWSPAKTSSPATATGRGGSPASTAPDRVISTVDPDTRHVHKSVSRYRDGYKAHVSVEPQTGLICAQRLTAGNAPDGPTGVELMAAEPPRRQVLADAAYGSGPTRAALRRRRHRLAIKPWPDRRHRPVRPRRLPRRP